MSIRKDPKQIKTSLQSFKVSTPIKYRAEAVIPQHLFLKNLKKKLY